MDYSRYARQLRAKLFNPPNAWRPSGIQIPPPAPIQEPPPTPITSSNDAMAVVCKFCAEQFRISVSDIKGEMRFKHIVLARHMAGYLAAAHLGIIVARIAEFLNKDHTSVMFGRNRISALLDLEGYASDRLRAIEQEFLDLHYPLFAIPGLSKPDMAVKAGWKRKKGGLSQRAIRGLEGRSGRRVAEAKIAAARQADRGGIPPSDSSQEAGPKEARPR